MAQTKKTNKKSSLLTRAREMKTWFIELTETNLEVVGKTPTLDKLEPAIVEQSDGRVGIHIKQLFSLNVQEAAVNGEKESEGAERAQKIKDIVSKIAKGLNKKEDKVSEMLLEVFTQGGEQEALRKEASDVGWKAYQLIQQDCTPDQDEFTKNILPIFRRALNRARQSVKLNLELLPYTGDITEFSRLITSSNDQTDELICWVINERVIAPPDTAPLITDFTTTDVENLGQKLKSEFVTFINNEMEGISQEEYLAKQESEGKENS